MWIKFNLAFAIKPFTFSLFCHIPFLVGNISAFEPLAETMFPLDMLSAFVLLFIAILNKPNCLRNIIPPQMK